MSSLVPPRRQEFRTGAEVDLIQRLPLIHPGRGRAEQGTPPFPMQGDVQVWWQEVEVVLVGRLLFFSVQ